MVTWVSVILFYLFQHRIQLQLFITLYLFIYNFSHKPKHFKHFKKPSPLSGPRWSKMAEGRRNCPSTAHGIAQEGALLGPRFSGGSAVAAGDRRGHGGHVAQDPTPPPVSGLRGPSLSQGCGAGRKCGSFGPFMMRFCCWD